MESLKRDIVKDEMDRYGPALPNWSVLPKEITRKCITIPKVAMPHLVRKNGLRIKKLREDHGSSNVSFHIDHTTCVANVWGDVADVDKVLDAFSVVIEKAEEMKAKQQEKKQEAKQEEKQQKSKQQEKKKKAKQQEKKKKQKAKQEEEKKNKANTSIAKETKKDDVERAKKGSMAQQEQTT